MMELFTHGLYTSDALLQAMRSAAAIAAEAHNEES